MSLFRRRRSGPEIWANAGRSSRDRSRILMTLYDHLGGTWGKHRLDRLDIPNEFPLLDMRVVISLPDPSSENEEHPRIFTKTERATLYLTNLRLFLSAASDPWGAPDDVFAIAEMHEVACPVPTVTGGEPDPDVFAFTVGDPAAPNGIFMRRDESTSRSTFEEFVATLAEVVKTHHGMARARHDMAAYQEKLRQAGYK